MSKDEIDERITKLSGKFEFESMICTLSVGDSTTIKREDQYVLTLTRVPSVGDPKYSVRFEMAYILSKGKGCAIYYTWYTSGSFSYSKEQHMISRNPLMISHSTERTMYVHELLDKLFDYPPKVMLGG